MLPKIANIPDEDHIVRHVPWKKLRKDEDDNVLGFLPQAFELRPDEDALSVSWLEFHKAPDTRVRDAIWEMRRARSVGGKSGFAIANVGKLKETCLTARSIKIRVVPEPLDNWLSHTGVRRLPRDDLDLLEALAVEAFTQIVLNEAIPAQPSS